jgi:hypothetical protein
MMMEARPVTNFILILNKIKQKLHQYSRHTASNNNKQKHTKTTTATTTRQACCDTFLLRWHLALVGAST